MPEKHWEALEEELVVDVTHGWKPLVSPLTNVGSLDHTAVVMDIVKSYESEHLSVQQSADQALDNK